MGWGARYEKTNGNSSGGINFGRRYKSSIGISSASAGKNIHNRAYGLLGW
jgi:hypothetical protein